MHIQRILLVAALAALGSAPAGALGLRGLALSAGGAFDAPLAQDDAAMGSAFHFGARTSLLPSVAAEASIGWIVSSDGETPSGERVEAPDLRSHHLAALLRAGPPGIGALVRVGLGWTRLQLPGGLGASNEPSYELGLALEVGFGRIRAELGPRLFVVDLGDATRKHLLAQLSVGVPLR